MNPEAQAPQPRPEKTEAQVADQINRIAGKLVDRAMELPNELRRDNYFRTRSEEGVALHTSGNSRFITTDDEQGNSTYVEADKHDEGTGLMRTDRNFNVGHTDDKPENQGVFIDAKTDGTIKAVHHLERARKSDREKTPLTLKQTITGAANILGGVRSEVAKREKIAKADNKKRIDTFVGSR